MARPNWPADVIVGFDTNPITTLDDLLAALDTRSAGDEVTLTLMRTGQTRDVQITLARGLGN